MSHNFSYQGAINRDGTIRIESITAVVICLQAKYSTRCKPSKKVLESLDVVHNVKSMKAITPADFEPQAVAHPHALTSIKDRRSQVSVHDLSHVNQIGCALSHIHAWKLCAEAGVPIMIAEDDLDEYGNQLLKTQKAMNHVPAEAHFVSLLHANSNGVKGFMDNKLFERHDQCYPVASGFYGLQCYILTPAGARILLAKAMPVVMHIDRYVSDCIASGLKLYRAGGSIAQTNFMGSTLGHSFPTSWTIPISLVIVALLLLCICIALGVALHKTKTR